jgi:hypothetical protein
MLVAQRLFSKTHPGWLVSLSAVPSPNRRMTIPNNTFQFRDRRLLELVPSPNRSSTILSG